MNKLTNCKFCKTKIRKEDKKSHENGCLKNKNRSKLKETNKKTRRKSISPSLRMNVWTCRFGDKNTGKCLCCLNSEITTFTGVNAFQAGHIISYKNGGTDVLDNLLPICKKCNTSMGRQHWSDYVKKKGFSDIAYFSKYEKGVIWWQSLWRMYKDRKNLYFYKIL